VTKLKAPDDAGALCFSGWIRDVRCWAPSWQAGSSALATAAAGAPMLVGFWFLGLVLLRCMSPQLALSWPNLPCALKAAIGIGKRTLGDPASLPRHRGPGAGPIRTGDMIVSMPRPV
jgi:hypothetical protein